MGILELLLTFLGGGALATLFSFLIQNKKEKRIDQQTINHNLFEQIGRLTEKIERLEKENDEKDLIILQEKEKSYKKDVLIEQLQVKLNEKDVLIEQLELKYEDLYQKYEEIKILLIKKEGN